MKILILYASKSGASKEVAEYIGKKIKNSSVVNFNKKQPSFKKYDLIILGSGIYFSKINRKFKKFIDNNIEDLLEKKFAIFFCSSNHKSKEIKKAIYKNFKGVLADNAIDIISAGGYLRPSKARFPFSAMLSMGQKVKNLKNQEPPKINHENIDKFIELISSVTIIEKDKQLRNNPIPPIKDIVTKKERIKNINKPKQKHKQIVDQKKKPKNEKIKTKQTKNKKHTSENDSNINNKNKSENKVKTTNKAKTENNLNKNDDESKSKTPNTNHNLTKTKVAENTTNKHPNQKQPINKL